MTDQLLFDRLRYMDKLMKDGSVPEAQARAMADALEDALQESVATKSDITRLENKIELAVRDLTIRMGGIGAAIVAILASIKIFG